MAEPIVVWHRVSSSLLGPEDPSFRALSGRLKSMVRRHKFLKDYFSLIVGGTPCYMAPELLYKNETIFVLLPRCVPQVAGFGRAPVQIKA